MIKFLQSDCSKYLSKFVFSTKSRALYVFQIYAATRSIVYTFYFGPIMQTFSTRPAIFQIISEKVVATSPFKASMFCQKQCVFVNIDKNLIKTLEEFHFYYVRDTVQRPSENDSIISEAIKTVTFILSFLIYFPDIKAKALLKG